MVTSLFHKHLQIEALFGLSGKYQDLETYFAMRHLRGVAEQQDSLDNSIVPRIRFVGKN